MNLRTIAMTPRTFGISALRTFAASLAALFLALSLLAAPSIVAQEVVEVTGGDKPLDADFEEVFRVGVLDGDAWEMFGTVRKAAFDADGRLYIFDGLGGFGGQGLRVLVFDAEGAFLHQFGSAGQGPGEFSMPMDFVVMRDGTTVVGDLGHRAYQLFDESGTFIRMVRGGEGTGSVAIARSIQPDPRGGGVYSAGGALTFGPPAGDDAQPPSSRPVVRIELGGEVLRTDTVAEGWLPPRPESDLPEIVIADLGSALVMPTVFEPPLLMGVLPDGGTVHSDSSAYAVKVTAPDAAGVARIITRPFQPAPVTPAIEEAESERRQARLEKMGAPGGRRMLEIRGPEGSNQVMSMQMPAPAYYHEIPVLRGLVTTWEGRIWVQRRGDEPDSDGPIDVLTTEGEYIGTFPTDAMAMPDAFGPNGVAAFIELDDFDVARVVVRRLPAAIR